MVILVSFLRLVSQEYVRIRSPREEVTQTIVAKAVMSVYAHRPFRYGKRPFYYLCTVVMHAEL